MIIVAAPSAPVIPRLRVKAVVVENEDGTDDRFIHGQAMTRLGIDHPEVIAQLTQS